MQTSTTSLITKSRRERQSFSQRSQAQFSYFWSVFMNDVEPFFRVFFLTTFIPRPKMKYVEIEVALRSATIFTPILAFCIFNPFSQQPLRESTLSPVHLSRQSAQPVIQLSHEHQAINCMNRSKQVSFVMQETNLF